MNQTNKAKQAKEIYKLQKALVNFSEDFNNRPWEEKTARERRIDHMANALLMELHKQVEEQKLEYAPEPANRTEQLADKFMFTSNALRRGQVPITDEIVDDLDKVVELVNLSNTAKTAAKDTAVKRKLKELGG